jgi:Plavaka transposase
MIDHAPKSTATLLVSNEDLNQSLAERRGRREHRQLPKRYRDILPDPPAALPPAPVYVLPEYAYPGSATPPAIVPAPAPAPSQEPMPVVSGVRRLLQSARNIFGLFRRYHAIHFPDHDPDGNITSYDLIDSPPHISSSPMVDSYYPYQNQSSFLLGEWYWNDGVKKSQSSFQNLIKIVGHPSFRPEDVAGENWRRIDAQLSGDLEGSSNEGGDWEDGMGHGSWIETPIKINVPFHKTTLHPGSKEFNAGILHHRKLVSVIREKITRPSNHPFLHFEPYELFWQPNEDSEPVRVHGELYTSDAFIEAHRDLQDSPGEPGCDLQRVVVGLMFASDSTQLTAFSDAKLWPVYLSMGNESKNRRSKPSCEGFEHVAYLETVCRLHAVL